MSHLITCEVGGVPRAYYLDDTGKPWEQKKLELSAGIEEVGGITVSRVDPPFHPSKGNAWVGQFRDLDSVLEFIHCLRGEKIKVIPAHVT